MATLGTYTLTLADDDGMTSEEASQVLHKVADFVYELIHNDERITSMPVTYADKSITHAST